MSKRNYKKEPMSVVEFIKAKNKIIKKDLGIVLVPEDQIEECGKCELDTDKALNACPYCQVYVLDDCLHCPMAKAGNRCEEDEGNTWDEFIAKTKGHPVAYYEQNKKLNKLYKNFNKQF